VYLVDHLHRVRWRGCGKSKPEEIDILIRCADDLLHVKGGDVPVLATKNRHRKKVGKDESAGSQGSEETNSK
jgi:hypothetical protein